MFKKKIISQLIFFGATLCACTANNAPKQIELEKLIKQNEDCEFSYYYNYVFFENESYSGIGSLRGSKVANVKKYDKTSSFRSKDLSLVSSLYDAVKNFGSPKSYGVESTKSLDYSIDDEKIYRLYLNDNSGVEDVIVLDKDNPSSWLDDSKTKLPSIEDAKKLEIGMSLDEVVNAIGKPQRAYSGSSFDFDLVEKDKVLWALFWNDYAKEEEWMKENDPHGHFGIRFLNLIDFQVLDADYRKAPEQTTSTIEGTTGESSKPYNPDLDGSL